MTIKDKVRWKLQKTFGKKQNLITARPGILGDGNGIVAVPGRLNYVYARVADVITQVFNVRVPPENDLQVLIGYDPMQPYMAQVLSTRSSEPGQNAGITGYAPASHYEWLGDDPVFIDKRLWLPRRISCYSGMTVKMYPDMFWTGTAYIALAEQTIDLSSYIVGLTTGHMNLVLITLDSAGTIVLTPTDDPVDIATATTADIPTPPEGTSDCLAVVRCYYGQTAVQEAITNFDILDLRLTYFGSGGAGGGASALADLTDVDLSTPQEEGQGLVWDDSESHWIPGDVGTPGDSAYVYIAYASDDSGTGFTLTFNASLNYIAIKHTTSEIVSPIDSDFTGLWKNYKGATGAAGINSMSALEYYMDDEDSPDVAGYEKIATTPPSQPQEDDRQTVTSGADVLLDKYVTNPGYPNVLEIPAGMWIFHGYGYREAVGSGNSSIIAKVYKRLGASPYTETLIATISSPSLTVTSATPPQEWSIEYYTSSPTAMLPADRIAIYIYGHTTATTREIHFIHSGHVYASHITTPSGMAFGNVHSDASVADNHLAVFDGDQYHIKDGGAIPESGELVSPTLNILMANKFG